MVGSCVAATRLGVEVGVGSAAPSRARTQLGSGLSIVVPPGWHVALRLSGLIEPYDRFTLASFALHRPPRAQLGCGPVQAVDGIPVDGALAFVVEYAPVGPPGRDFPPQPKRFVLPPGPPGDYDCFGRGWILRFSVGERPFQIMIALGQRAGANQGRLLRALSSLRVVAAAG